MSDTDFPDMGSPLYSFYRTGFENCRKPSIVRDDPDGGDPHIIAVLGRIYDPERLQDLVNAKNREILTEDAMTNTKAQTAKHTPGFRVEEIYRALDGGDRVAAVKMLRAETGCGLKEAIDALNGRCIETLPSFEEAARRKRIERAAPELLAALKIVCEASQLAVSALDSDDPGADSMMQKFWRSLEPARAAIARATGDA